SLAAAKRVLADGVEDNVVGLAVLREVLVQVVDDLVRAERAHELDVRRVADRGYVRPQVLPELHASGSDRAGSAVDEHLLALDADGSVRVERAEDAVRDAGDVLVPHAVRDLR